MTLVTLLVALSVASERLVEIVKNLVTFLNQEIEDPKREGQRKAILQGLAVASGIVTALLARPAIVDVVPAPWQSPVGILALGLLASGGSGFWNAILEYLLKVKDIKKFEAALKKRELEDKRQETGHAH